MKLAKDMTNEEIERELRMIEAEINLMRTPWQSPQTSEGEKHVIFQRTLSLVAKQREIEEEQERRLHG